MRKGRTESSTHNDVIKWFHVVSHFLFYSNLLCTMDPQGEPNRWRYFCEIIIYDNFSHNKYLVA